MSPEKKEPKLASRIPAAFDRIRSEKRTGLVTYVTAGDPDLPRSADILRALDRAGADVLEVGIPFSEPLADGPVIQRAIERALAGGATASGVLDVVGSVRASIRAPIVLFSYANPILRMGVDRFGDRAKAAGVDGVLVLDLPIEEAVEFRESMAARGIDMIFLLSPTTTDARVRQAAHLGRGHRHARQGGRRRPGAGRANSRRHDAADRAGLRHFEPGTGAADRQMGRRGRGWQRARGRDCGSGKRTGSR
jgi:tryptophan synthase alpha subunit